MKQQQSQSAESTRERRREYLKLDIYNYRGVEEDSLLRWFVEVDGAIKAHRIDDELMKVSFAQSCLAGDARKWALNHKLHDPNVFGLLNIFNPCSVNRLSRPGQSSGLYQSSLKSNRVSVMFTLTTNMCVNLQAAW